MKVMAELNATKQSAALATAQYDTFSNILYPHQQTLLESLIRAAVVEETNAGVHFLGGFNETMGLHDGWIFGHRK
ncbi:hypothetical protein I7I51_08063 [Histoplasma capsulatum]|uniref:Uncharacterized protein n=1 Tax=Ajellomyces capsulatus TaxID=5037 RepID=A0A8A1LZE8_AJECA|nr:hypothetical protein I7I51_08063 [Histoplasma capsulatum]